MNVTKKLLLRYKSLGLKVNEREACDFTIYDFAAYGLGDQCRLVNYLLMNNYKNIKLQVRRPKLVNEMLSLFDSYPNNIIAPLNFKEHGKRIDLKHYHLGKYLKFKKHWTPNNSKMILTQLKGSHARSWMKNTPEEGINKLKLFMNNLGFRIEEINHDNKLPLQYTVDIMNNSRLFIGIESGWSHIAHSSGIPCIIIKNNQIGKFIYNYHVGNEYTVYNNVNELISKFDITLKSYKDNL